MGIDDVQWLDTATAKALAFALRRLDGAPVGVLATRRGDERADDSLRLDDALPAGTVSRLRLGPLTLDALARILRARSSAPISRPLLVRLTEASRGNPLLFLELARAIAEPGGAVEPGKPFPSPRTSANCSGRAWTRCRRTPQSRCSTRRCS